MGFCFGALGGDESVGGDEGDVLGVLEVGG